MKFEHLIQINDLSNSLIQCITREQLWQGLVMRAELPKLFVPYIDECDITNCTVNGMTRRIKYGELYITDQVLFAPLHYVHYDVAAQGEIPQSSLRMSIEEPEPNCLFVRFCYCDGYSAEHDAENEMYNEYRRSAYHEADINTVRLIRELAETGRLDTLPC